MTQEPTLQDITREFPWWHCWVGISGLLYGRLGNSSPPIVVRAEDTVDLRDQIKGIEGLRDAAGNLPSWAWQRSYQGLVAVQGSVTR